MRDAAKLADELGIHSIWTWDHFYALSGAEERPNFDAWQILPAWAAVTERVRIGALVSGITYRHPAVLANMAATFDHISNGRAICGIGAAWNQTEHRAYGIDLGTAGERSRRFAEGARIVRSLLDGKRVTYSGKYYSLSDAVLNTRPVQQRVPIMIGGGGEQRTLRTTARYADMWHGFGTPEIIRRKIEILHGHCADVGRDPSAITIFAGRAVCVREDPAEAKRTLAEIASHHHGMQPQDAIIGGPDQVAERLKAYWDAGARGFIVGFPYPYDTVTMRRLAQEVLPRLRDSAGVAA